MTWTCDNETKLAYFNAETKCKLANIGKILFIVQSFIVITNSLWLKHPPYSQIMQASTLVWVTTSQQMTHYHFTYTLSDEPFYMH